MYSFGICKLKKYLVNGDQSHFSILLFHLFLLCKLLGGNVFSFLCEQRGEIQTFDMKSNKRETRKRMAVKLKKGGDSKDTFGVDKERTKAMSEWSLLTE